MNISIEKATLSDIGNIRDHHIPREKLAGCINGGYVHVLKENGEITGFLRYSLFWQLIPFLDLIYIYDDFQHKGRGSRLMEYWEGEMKKAGYEYVMISTQEDETAKYFYEKLGYSKIGAFLPPGQDADELMYLKYLK